MMTMSRMLIVASVLMASAAFGADPSPAKAQTPKNLSATAQPAVPSANANPAPQSAAPSQKSANPARHGNDRLDLDTTVVTGNRELPKVMYIVPWKKADIGDLPAQPFNTLLDEALTPVDRDVFRREVTYYGALSSGADRSNPGSSTPAASPEK
jgi:hypothetical protein